MKVKAANRDVLDANLLEYRPFDHFEPHLGLDRNDPIKRSFTLIIKSAHENFFVVCDPFKI